MYVKKFQSVFTERNTPTIQTKSEQMKQFNFARKIKYGTFFLEK